MKNFITLLFITIMTFNTNAQCIFKPSCQNSKQVCQTLHNQAFNGNYCFHGFGTIHSSVNWNNWDWLSFLSIDSTLVVNQVINCNNGAKKIWVSGQKVWFTAHISVQDNDTIIVQANSSAHFDQFIVNSNPSSHSVIILENGASMEYGNNLPSTIYNHNPGYVDTIVTANGNHNKDIYVISCNSTPLPIRVRDFYILDDYLYWSVEDPDRGDIINIQYSTNADKWTNIFSEKLYLGSLKLTKLGYYRLNYSLYYSSIRYYNPISIKVSEEKLIYYDGKSFSTEKPKSGWYGTKKIK